MIEEYIKPNDTGHDKNFAWKSYTSSYNFNISLFYLIPYESLRNITEWQIFKFFAVFFFFFLTKMKKKSHQGHW